MRLIDAEYVLWKVQSEAFPQSVDFGQGRESVLEEIRKAPTVDAEPVVRCKDCVKWEPCEDGVEGYCPYIIGVTGRNDYCSGARMEGVEHD